MNLYLRLVIDMNTKNYFKSNFILYYVILPYLFTVFDFKFWYAAPSSIRLLLCVWFSRSITLLSNFCSSPYSEFPLYLLDYLILMVFRYMKDLKFYA